MTQPLLEEHAHDGNHGQTAVGKLRRELALLDLRVIRREHLPSEVTCSSRSSRRLVLGHLAEGHVGRNLAPPCRWNLGDGSQAIGHVRELQAHGRREVSRELSGDLRGHVTHACEHGDSAVLDLRCSTAGIGLSVAIRGEADGVPKSERWLHTELILEGTQRRGGVVGPVSPGASSQAIL